MSVPPNENATHDNAVPERPTPAPSIGVPSAQEKQWALFAHLSAIAGAAVTGHVFGIGCFIGPLIIWMVKRDTMPFVADQGKEALNFNITIAIIGVALFLLVVMTFGLGLLLAIPAGSVVAVGWLIFTVIAAIKASEGVAYRYPITLRLVK